MTTLEQEQLAKMRPGKLAISRGFVFVQLPDLPNEPKANGALQVVTVQWIGSQIAPVFHSLN